MPEYYADLFRRFATFCPDFSGNRLTRVACGPGGFDQNWTRVMMERAAGNMQAYSLHYYTVWPDWKDKTTATAFGEKNGSPCYTVVWKSNGRFARPKM